MDLTNLDQDVLSEICKNLPASDLKSFIDQGLKNRELSQKLGYCIQIYKNKFIKVGDQFNEIIVQDQQVVPHVTISDLLKRVTPQSSIVNLFSGRDGKWYLTIRSYATVQTQIIEINPDGQTAIYPVQISTKYNVPLVTEAGGDLYFINEDGEIYRWDSPNLTLLKRVKVGKFMLDAALGNDQYALFALFKGATMKFYLYDIAQNRFYNFDIQYTQVQRINDLNIELTENYIVFNKRKYEIDLIKRNNIKGKYIGFIVDRSYELYQDNIYKNYIYGPFTFYDLENDTLTQTRVSKVSVGGDNLVYDDLQNRLIMHDEKSGNTLMYPQYRGTYFAHKSGLNILMYDFTNRQIKLLVPQ